MRDMRVQEQAVKSSLQRPEQDNVLNIVELSVGSDVAKGVVQN